MISHSETFPLVATAAFGLEAIVVRELKALGYESKVTRPGRIEFQGTLQDMCRANLWLRSSDRVLLRLAAFKANDFELLFETTRELPWEVWIQNDAEFPVRAKTHKSTITSIPAIQRAVKKAIVERLLSVRNKKENSNSTIVPETGPPVAVEIALLEDEATLSIDTTGDGLHRRGYRTLTGPAQIRETLAAAMVQLSFWKPGRPFLDPFCGSGTIVIEAAMIGRNIAPGRNRTFAAESWAAVPEAAWKQAREECDDLVLPNLEEKLIAYDASGEALKLARYHASKAGVEEDIHFQVHEFAEVQSSRHYGCLITNPPYGLRLGEDEEIEELYQSMPEVLRRFTTWSHYILTARLDFETLVGQEASRRRKLYNGGVECTYFQFYGPKPTDKGKRPKQVADATGSDGNAQEASGGSAEENVQPTFGPPKKNVTTRKPVQQAFGGLKEEAKRQATEFTNRLKKLARHLRRWPTKRGITCYRIYDRDIPEIPLAVDLYEDALHIAEYERPHDRTAAQHADWLDAMVKTAGEALGISQENLFVKYRERQRSSSQYSKFNNVKAVRIVQEDGLKFQVNLSDYLDTGLFLDHRATRGMVREVAKGKRFLNLFAYTGAFTVYAADGSAAATTTVDLSQKYLDWAKENLRINGLLDLQSSTGQKVGHRFVCSDIGDFLLGLPEKETFDLAVVDPPTFSNSKDLEFDWDVQRDHAPMLLRLMKHITPGGIIFFSTNSRRFKFDAALLEPQTTNIREISKHTVPEDFRNKRIHRCWKIVVK